MYLIVGLGNPGKEYEKTRHNIGWRVVDAYAEQQGVGFSYEKKWDADIAKIDDVLLCKPQTFMNNSGMAVAAIARYFTIAPEHILAVYDDKDIPFGTVRVRSAGSAGGHNGVQSLIQHVGTMDFWRIRIGVASSALEKRDTADFVLSPFSSEEEQCIPHIITIGKDSIEKYSAGNLEHTDYSDECEPSEG